MAAATRKPPRRRRLPNRRRRWLILLLAGLAASAAAAWPRVRTHPVFRVEVIELVECPDHLRGQVAEVLHPLLGRTFFDVREMAPDYLRQLRKLPEVAYGELACRPPHTVEVRLTPRVPTLALKLSGGWAHIDDTGRVVRVDREPLEGRAQVHGLVGFQAVAGQDLEDRRVQQAVMCVRAAQLMLQAEPRTVSFDADGGGLRMRTAAGDHVVLGQAEELERKLQVYQAVRRRLSADIAYIDVSAPQTPVWAPVPPPAAEAETSVAPQGEVVAP